MPTAAILPVKSFTRAKQRLGQTLADPLRPMLAEAMVADVLAALSSASAIARTIVVTREPSVMEAVAGDGETDVISDEGETGQSAAAVLGIGHALREGFDRVLCVPGDCPALDPAELDELLGTASPDSPGVVVLPDRHGTGTNGLLLSPPDAIEPSFGPGSCERHLSLARTAMVEGQVHRLQSLLLDIDTGADLAVLRARLGELGERAERTKAVLARPEFALPLAASA
ncbi:MAG TPA: 2-phospho-L-lactate guanylyltransferase [Solirubrobacteraceae bacterium]|nr:2-phospho-L-lactate guanylyltransferase [Solirubrobacteraceae bacterium]